METVAIIGVGLIGASFGLALRATGFSGPILGVSSPGAISEGMSRGAISEACTLTEAAARADLLYLAQPIDRILITIEELAPLLQSRSECLVTDAGSTKVEIVRCAEQFLRPDMFLGGHPMAGKEQRGANAADAALFKDRPYVLTPSDTMLPKMKRFRELVDSLGAHSVITSATEHDVVVAFTSHLPQLISSAISVTLAEQPNIGISEIFGPGLLDMTRLAMSSPSIWQSVLRSNRNNILQVLAAFRATLDNLSYTIQVGSDLDSIFSAGQQFAINLRRVK
jgi:prephenate dehydrogenase